VDPDVVRFLWDLYRQQKAYVCLDTHTRSKLFAILRGVRQGDPLSPVLFNNVTGPIFHKLKEKWSRSGLGTVVCSGMHDTTSHAMFADDTTLFASSKRALIRMIKDVQQALAEHGLNLNIDKCLVQTSRLDISLQPLLVDGQPIPMVSASDGFKSLGTQWTLHGRTSAELHARIGAVWRKFHTLWPLLGKRDGNLSQKLKVFDASVTQTALWCCESWLLTKTEKRLLESTQNNMLRRIAGPRRRPEEQWVDWVKRSTRAARKSAQAVGIRFWLEAHLRAKWTWAGHVLRMDPSRLACRSTQWRDSVWWTKEIAFPVSLRMHRPHRTHWFRWEDDLRRYAADRCWSSWQSVAQKRDEQGNAYEGLRHCKASANYTTKK